MDRSQFWMNFKLGEELRISGRFIYNGLRAFHEMDHLNYEEEVFEVLYNLSVGLERLMKIAIILIEYDNTIDRNEFDNSLRTHTHLELLRRVQQAHNLRLAAPHNEFLQILETFYKTHRYGRYHSTNMQAGGKEKDKLHAYIEKHLKIEFTSMPMTLSATNSPRIRGFLGKIVGKIASELYRVICQEASRRDIFTYELRYDSKAAKVFLRKEYDFINEEVLWRELLVFFINSERAFGHLGFMKWLKPLEFDPGLEAEYLQCFTSDERKLQHIDELESLYAGVDKPGERLEAIKAIGDPYVDFEPVEEDDEK